MNGHNDFKLCSHVLISYVIDLYSVFMHVVLHAFFAIIICLLPSGWHRCIGMQYHSTNTAKRGFMKV